LEHLPAVAAGFADGAVTAGHVAVIDPIASGERLAARSRSCVGFRLGELLPPFELDGEHLSAVVQVTAARSTGLSWLVRLRPPRG
jgi:hypothetical protein